MFRAFSLITGISEGSAAAATARLRDTLVPPGGRRGKPGVSSVHEIAWNRHEQSEPRIPALVKGILGVSLFQDVPAGFRKSQNNWFAIRRSGVRSPRGPPNHSRIYGITTGDGDAVRC